MQTPSLTAAVRNELLARPNVTEAEHRFGGVVFHLGRRELGHLHGETVADLPLPAHIRADLAAGGRIDADYATADSDWVSRRVDGPGDVAAVVELFRISYEHAASERALHGEPEEEPAPADAEERDRGWRGLLGLRRRR